MEIVVPKFSKQVRVVYCFGVLFSICFCFTFVWYTLDFLMHPSLYGNHTRLKSTHSTDSCNYGDLKGEVY